MKKSIVYFSFILLVLSAINASAKVSLDSTPKDVYSLGDDLSIIITTIPASNYGNLNINLNCKNNTINILKWPVSYFGEQSNYELPTKSLTKEDLEIENLDDILGDCYVSALLGNEQDSTDNFIITRDILIDASLDKLKYNPGEKITLTVNAKKANGDFVEGVLMVSGATSFKKAVSGGQVIDSFSLPKTTESGEYELELFVHDTGDNGEIMNFGNKSLLFSINQVPSFIEIVLSDIEAEPGEDFKINSNIYDQSGKQMDGTVSIIAYSFNGEELQTTFQSGDSGSVNIPYNATPGSWKIKALFKEIIEEREFSVKSMPKVEFEFIDSILVIRNIGNDVYNKTIEVKIGESLERLFVNIEPGETRKFNLKAPKGEYLVFVDDGSDSIEKNLLLTGGAVSINDVGALSWFNKYPTLWLLILFFLCVISAYLLHKYKRRNIKSIEDSDDEEIGNPKKSKRTNKVMVDMSKLKVGEAKPNDNIKGEKAKSSVIALKLENYNELSDSSKQNFNGILSSCIEGTKGMVDFRDEFVFVIYSPIASKTFENEKIALKTAFKISNKLGEYNRKFASKIGFSISLNSGDLIASLSNGKLEYTSVGSTILLARRMCDLGKSKVFVSEEVKLKLGRDVKLDKAGVLGKTNVYSVQEIQDRSSDREKLANILKRINTND